MTPQCSFKVTMYWRRSVTNQPFHKWSTTTPLFLRFLRIGRDYHEVNLRRSDHSISEYSPRSPRVHPSSPRVLGNPCSLQRKTVRDDLKIAVITKTRAWCSAKKAHVTSKKVLQLSSEDKARNTWRSRHLPQSARGDRVNQCAYNLKE